MAPLAIGDLVLGRYRILEELGLGGMGKVHRAFDEKLEHDVAIKELPPELARDPEALERLRDEAKSMAAAAHPNVAIVHDLAEHHGTTLIVMECVDGPTPQGPMPAREACRIILEVLDGLRAAHAKGIVHRDVKPGNIKCPPEGPVKVLDFGLANRVRRARSMDDTASGVRTVSGTLRYMAPEQLAGAHCNQRTDLWAVGLTLFELCTGRQFYAFDNVDSLCNAILHVHPERPPYSRNLLPDPVWKIVRRALQKKPEDRYQNAEDMKRDLRAFLDRRPVAVPPWLQAAALSAAVLIAAVAVLQKGCAPAPVPRLVVLPVNYRGEPGHELFGDGLFDQVRVFLAQLDPSRLEVIGPESSAILGGGPLDYGRVHRDLAATHAISATINYVEPDFKVLTTLVRVPDGTTLWAADYTRRASDILSLQTEIARAITNELAVQLLPAKLPVYPDNPDARDAFAQGRGLLQKRRDEGDLLRAAELFQRAVDLEPAFAAAHASLADALVLLMGFEYGSPEELVSTAREHARRALDLDSTLAAGHIALATIAQDYDWDWSAASQSYRRAIALGGGDAVAHQRYAGLLVLQGRFDHALAELNRARSLEPASAPIASDLAVCHLYRGDAVEAAEWAARGALLESGSPTAWDLVGQIQWYGGHHDSAMVAFATALRLRGAPDSSIEGMLASYEFGGAQGLWKWRLDRLEAFSRDAYVSPFQFAKATAALGRQQEALDWLDRALAERASSLPTIVVDPAFVPLHAEPRFVELVHRLGLKPLPPRQPPN